MRATASPRSSSSARSRPPSPSSTQMITPDSVAEEAALARRRRARGAQPARVERRVRDADDGGAARAAGRPPRRRADPRGARRARGPRRRPRAGNAAAIAALERWLDNAAETTAMSFRSILRSIVEECGGGLGAVLMGADGIPIEEYVTDRIPEGPLQEDIGSAGVEFSRILDEIRKAADALGGGARQRDGRVARAHEPGVPADRRRDVPRARARAPMATSARRAISSAAICSRSARSSSSRRAGAQRAEASESWAMPCAASR